MSEAELDAHFAELFEQKERTVSVTLRVSEDTPASHPASEISGRHRNLYHPARAAAPCETLCLM